METVTIGDTVYRLEDLPKGHTYQTLIDQGHTKVMGAQTTTPDGRRWFTIKIATSKWTDHQFLKGLDELVSRIQTLFPPVCTCESAISSCTMLKVFRQQR